MTTTTRTKKATKQQPRTAKLMTLGTVQVLALTQGKDTTFYRLETLLDAAGKGFRLVKAECGNGPEETYDVHLDGQRSTCECKGFLRWGYCKHVSSLGALLLSGKLEAPAVKPQPAPAPQQPAKQEPFCPFCNDDTSIYCHECSI